MRHLITLVALVLVACTSTPPTPPARNRAIEFVSFAEPGTECLAIDPPSKNVDAAVCRVVAKDAKGKDVPMMLRCYAGGSVEPHCKPLRDEEPRAMTPTAPQAEAVP